MSGLNYPLPWEYDEINFGGDGYPFGLIIAALCAVEFADAVMKMDAEAEGYDWASQIQRRIDASLGEMIRRLPPSAPPAVRKLAAVLLEIEGHRP